MKARKHTALEQWLSEKSEGRESSPGAFTVSKERAWKKLGACQLPTETAWMLKFVQAGSCAGASSISVTQTKKTTSITVYDVPEWSRDSVEASILEDSPGRLDLAHLSKGLRALLVSEHAVLITDPEGASAVWDGEGFQDIQPDTETAVGSWTVEISHSKAGQRALPFTQAKSDAVRYCSGIARDLTSRCYLAPMPIRLDRRIINDIKRNSDFGTAHKRTFLTLVPLKTEIPCAPPWASRTTRICNYSFLNDAAFDSLGSGMDQWSVGLGLTLNHQQKDDDELGWPAETEDKLEPGPSRLVWVTDGVVVDNEKIPIKKVISLAVVCQASGLKTDLSGLMLSDSKEKRMTKKSALGSVAEKLQEVLELQPFVGEEILTDTRNPAYQEPGPGCFFSSLFVVLGAIAIYASPLWVSSVFKGHYGRPAMMIDWMRSMITNIFAMFLLCLPALVVVLAIWHRINPNAAFFTVSPKKNEPLAKRLRKELRQTAIELIGLVKTL
jgi:hypothetical protein